MSSSSRMSSSSDSPGSSQSTPDRQIVGDSVEFPIDSPDSQLQRIFSWDDALPWGLIIRGFNTKLLDTENASALNLTVAERRQSNAAAPVNKLSDEVLGYIFTLLVTVDHGPLEPTPQSQIADCIAKDSVRYSSQVCTHWRRLALGMPSLWNNVDIGRYGARTWSEEFIKRSHPLPLNIRCFNSSEFYDIVHAADLLPRLYMVASWYCKSETWGIVLGWSLLSTSKLKIFSFNWPQRRGGKPLPLPSFTGSASSITELHFRNCRSHLDSPLFANLLVLRIENNDAYHGEWEDDGRSDIDIRLTEYDLAVGLLHMPLLAELHLLHAFSNLDSPPLPYPCLPHLTRLSIKETYTGYSDGCPSVLFHLNVPKSCAFDITFGDVRLGTSLDQSINKIMDSVHRSWDSDATPSLLIDFPDGVALGQSLFESGSWIVDAKDEPCSDMTRNRNRICLKNDLKIDWVSYIMPLLKQSLSKVVFLRFGVSKLLPAAYLPHLTEFINVTNLCLQTFRGYPDLLGLLKLSKSFHSSSGSVLFPSLCKIILIFTSEKPLQKIASHLTSFIRWRQDVQAEIKGIEFWYATHACKVNEQTVKDLEIKSGVRVDEYLKRALIRREK